MSASGGRPRGTWWLRWVHETLALGLLLVGGTAAIVTGALGGSGTTLALGVVALLLGLILGAVQLLRAWRSMTRS